MRRLHKLRTPAEASIGCSGLCAGPGGANADLFFNDPLNLCVKSISFAGNQVLFKLTRRRVSLSVSLMANKNTNHS